ncbi:hypothetical protein Ancab_034508 [Ancistrocladus abbreviatus]
MRESLPPKLLHEKLPRFLQKCAQNFQSDRRYRNDLRYIRMWLQLMDYVEDPKALLRNMEKNQIGIKRSLFYEAYALYYEKLKKFEAAEKMYQLGAENLAEPLDKLQKSYEQFLQRMEQHKKKKIQVTCLDYVFLCSSLSLSKAPLSSNCSISKQHQERKIAKRPLSDRSIPLCSSSSGGNDENPSEIENRTGEPSSEVVFNCLANDSNKILRQSSRSQASLDVTGCNKAPGILSNGRMSSDASTNKQVIEHIKTGSQIPQFEGSEKKLDESSMLYRDDSVVLKFVDTAIIGKSGAENACHHGLVEPTINMKEAMNAINNMFREPLEPPNLVRRSIRGQPNQSSSSGFEVFSDEIADNEVRSVSEGDMKRFPVAQSSQTKMHQPLQEPLSIFIDDEESDELNVKVSDEHDLGQSELQIAADGSPLSSQHVAAYVFLRPKDHLPDTSGDQNIEKASKTSFREDTVFRRFVGSAISDEPKVENICHHGLVDPTVNLKEAMDDINSMFGKPIDFVRTARKKRKEKAAPVEKNHPTGFSILPDDELACQKSQLLPSSTSSEEVPDLYEPTVCMKEAMDEINKMFAMPLDF